MKILRLSLIFVLLALPAALVAAAPALTWKNILRQPAGWYATTPAFHIADNVLLYQTESGGWPKNREMTLPPDQEAAARKNPVAEDEKMPTIDNDATHTQIHFLARVNAVAPDQRYAAAIVRGIDYLLAAQYPNGGWPQFYPLRHGYYSHITFNDDAMTEVAGLLREVARGGPLFGWVDTDRRARCAAAVRKGIDCILRCQVRVDGKPTVWCAQHDEVTLAPAPARRFEPVSLSGQESVVVIRFLMGEENPSPEIIAAIRGAVAWFESVRVHGVRIDRIPNAALPHGYDKVLVPDPQAPDLWARFYEIGTNRPIFTGRDAVVRYDFMQVEPERRGGYNYYTDAPRRLLEQDYPRWAARWLKPARP
jgi:PelA/Pel-15E family pectate lyase